MDEYVDFEMGQSSRKFEIFSQFMEQFFAFESFFGIFSSDMKME